MTKTSTFASFAALSVIVHGLIVFGIPLAVPQRDALPFTLVARLQPSAAPPAALARAKPRALHPAATHRILTKPIVPAPSVLALPAQLVPEPALVEPLPAPQEAPVTPVIASPSQRPLTAPVVVEAPPAPAPLPTAVASIKSPAQPAPVLARRLPRKGEIAYAVYLGNNKFNVGRTLQTWEIKDDKYRLASVSETTGIADLFSRQRLVYESSGKLTPSGLQPEHFTTQRLRSGRTEDAMVDFDWGAMSAAIGNPQREVTLPAAAQDIVSFMYQLGLMALAPGRIELPITNGWKLERYELDIGKEEQLETPFGTLRVVSVKQAREPGQESIELWLAPDYRWLPVRIRFFNREGEPSGEQLVSEIRVSDE
jgi:hypothetical protein